VRHQGVGWCGNPGAAQNRIVTYRESATAVPGAVLWRDDDPAPGPGMILPDGCLDLLWDGRRLFVAGPDTTARHFHRPAADHADPADPADHADHADPAEHADHADPAEYADPAEHYVALRFSGGLGPALLGIPADALTDRSVNLEDLWPAAPVRRLSEQVADHPVGALTGWLLERARRTPADPLGTRVAAMAAAGTPVATMADRTGLSARQLQRRCLPLFGYSPRHLARVLRLQRAVHAGQAGRSLAEVAAEAGYCDQAHLSREVRALAGATPRAVLKRVTEPSERTT
jgi:AraC-like DNA-binding protein